MQHRKCDDFDKSLISTNIYDRYSSLSKNCHLFHAREGPKQELRAPIIYNFLPSHLLTSFAVNIIVFLFSSREKKKNKKQNTEKIKWVWLGGSYQTLQASYVSFKFKLCPFFISHLFYRFNFMS